MSAELIPFDQAGVPAELANLLGGEDANDDLSSGVSGGFSVLSFRGSKWRIKHSGEETLITDADGETIASLRVVLLKANKNISKNYYKEGFVEGSTDAPTCFSVDGEKPDASVENPQNSVCATCPHNQFGSRITDTGSKAKACSDTRRVAVIPEGDFKNERFGGPMLLRVPAASLSELASYGKAMKAKHYPYNTIVTRVSFDPDTAYPKLKFNALRPLTGDESAEIIELLKDEDFRQKLDFILAKPVEVEVPKDAAPAEPKAQDPYEFEEPPAEEKKAAAKPAPEPKPEPVVEAEPEKASGKVLDDDIDDILAKLDNLD